MRSIRSSIFLTVAILLSIGVVMIYSASSIYAYEKMGDSLYFLKRHLAYLAIGIVVMFAAMTVDINLLKRLSRPILLISLFLLILVLVPHVGKETAGARRWFKFAFLSFQPSEFAKFAVILYTADMISRKGRLMKSFLFGYVPAVFVLGTFVGLILLEPDMGTAITISIIVMMMLFAAGVKKSHIFTSFLAALPAVYLLLFSVPYRRKRITAFLNPWADRKGAGFQIIQSFIALGSGGLFGVGLGQSRQKLFFLPASHTDFIFSIIGEELGLLGTASVVILFIIFVWQGMKIVFNSYGPFERSLSLGIVSLITLEAIVNIGVTCGALPTKGLPLPFISYGGSGLVFRLMGIGLLLNAGKICETYR
ncbi:MAG: cell division protein FtsW [Omnitrophica bacterium RIFCSPLOWO2_01_FULL_45_10]|nr:MAG: cell division protein FtsW [Omnitrophica bacterium RIFCSPLOWO2_01_FULL_45_10]